MQSPEGRFIQTLSAICSEDGAFNVLPPLSFRTGAHTGEESPGLGGGDRTTGSLAALGMTGETKKEGGFRGEHGSRPEIAPPKAVS